MQSHELKCALQKHGGIAMAAALDVTPSLSSLRELIVPDNEKMYWEEYAEFLTHLPTEIIEELAAELLIWTQDLNWPGCKQIVEKIKGLPYPVKRKAVDAARNRARTEADYEWIYNLSTVFDC